MSILFRDAHNIDHYQQDLSRNHDHRIGHIADEVAHNLRYADFGFSTKERLGYTKG